MVCDYEAAWLRLSEYVAGKTQHGREGLLVEMQRIAAECRVPSGELSRLLRLYGVEVERARQAAAETDRDESGDFAGGEASPVDDEFWSWLAGFIDGEGSFVIVHKRGGRSGGSYGCEFHIHLRADDEPILRTIRDHAGLGIVRAHSPGGDNGNRHPQAVWAVRTQADCLALIRILDRFPLRAKKARDYAIWRAAVQEWASEERPRFAKVASDWSRIAALKQQLEEGRQYRDDSDDFAAGRDSAADTASPGVMEPKEVHDVSSNGRARAVV